MIEKYDIMKKEFDGKTVTCERCGKTAESFDEIISMMGVNFETELPQVNKHCKICSND